MDYHLHELAYLNLMAGQKKKSGKKEKYIYPTFEKFYNRERVIENILHPEKERERKNMITEIGKLMQKGGE